MEIIFPGTWAHVRQQLYLSRVAKQKEQHKDPKRNEKYSNDDSLLTRSQIQFKVSKDTCTCTCA